MVGAVWNGGPGGGGQRGGRVAHARAEQRACEADVPCGRRCRRLQTLLRPWLQHTCLVDQSMYGAE